MDENILSEEQKKQIIKILKRQDRLVEQAKSIERKISRLEKYLHIEAESNMRIIINRYTLEAVVEDHKRRISIIEQYLLELENSDCENY